LEKLKKLSINLLENLLLSRSVRLNSMTKNNLTPFRERLNYKRIYFTKTLHKFMKSFANRIRSISSWNTAKMESFLIESIDQDLCLKRKQHASSIKSFLRYYISKKADLVIGTSSLRTCSLMNIGTWNSLTLASVVLLILVNFEKPFVELLHILPLKSSKNKVTILS